MMDHNDVDTTSTTKLKLIGLPMEHTRHINSVKRLHVSFMKVQECCKLESLDSKVIRKSIFLTVGRQLDVTASMLLQNTRIEPFFMYLALQSVHGPLSVPSNYSNLYPHVDDPVRKTYLGMITAMDEAIGNIIASLDKTNKLDDTIIFFASDNGGFTGELPFYFILL